MSVALVLIVADAPVFTVVSIKPNTSGSNRSNLDLQAGGRFVAVNVSIMALVRIAYGDDGPLTRDRLIVNDKWPQRRMANADQYDIQAIAERDLTEKELGAALRHLLEDRFALAVHHETRELRGYDLALARVHCGSGEALLENALADGRPVADKTGLDGSFEFELDWTSDQTPAPRPAPPVDPNGPFFVTALRARRYLPCACSCALSIAS